MRMTLDAVAGPRRTRISRKTVVILIAITALGGLAGYFARYGLCEARSKFCVVEIAGTRSEVGVEWDSWSVYVSTYPEE